MSTTAKTMSTNSFGFSSPKSSSTCNICKRLLYSFEEILVCRVCHGSYHWRCVKPETISHYGENTHFICDKCNDNITTTASPTHRLSNGGIRIKSPDSSETDYRNFVNIPSKLNSIPTKDTPVVNAVRYFEEKQQQQQQTPSISKNPKLNEHINGQYTDDTNTIHRIQQQTALESEDDTTAGMFQANYQYTPLKEYAAMKNIRSTNETNINDYQNSSASPKTERQVYSRFNGDIHYTNKSSSHFTSPTVDNLSVHNRQQHFISSTNLNVNDASTRRQQQPLQETPSSLTYSTPYLSQVRDDDESPSFKSPYHHQQQQQQQTDRHSNVGSDSGIVMNNSQHQQPTNDDGQLMEKKLTDLVQQLGRQLETDAQKLSEKLELKLKNLEYMIHQQTYIIRRQDEVIERLKSKILKIESERDHFRDRLSVHEQREQDEKKYTTETDETPNRRFEQDDQLATSNDVSTNRKFSTTSSASTDHSRRSSTKKTPAPRVDHPGLVINTENESTLAKLINAVPTNQEHRATDSPIPTTTARLVSTVPLVDKPAASSRLDDIIHQSGTNNETSSPYYNLEIKQKRSASSSSSSTSASASASAIKNDEPSTTNTGLPPRNSNFHRSLEEIPRKNAQTERVLHPSNKTTSLEFGRRPGEYDDPGSIYVTPQRAPHPASEYQNTMKGWLRKQNRDSFFKRIERYYCVLSKNALLMHKHENDTTPQKAITLQGAKVVQYTDPKFGPSLELTWTRRNNGPKRYHLYASNESEAQQWHTAIQTAIQNPDEKNKWQQYRMQT